MKILHINSYFNGSAFYKNLYDTQIKDGLDISVFVPVSNNALVEKYNFGKYTKISFNHGKYDRIFFYLKHQKIYKDIVSAYNIDEFSITHAHSLFSNGYIAMRLKKDFNIPYVVAVRNSDVNVFFRNMPHLRKLGIEILKEASKIVFLSETYRKTVIVKYIPSKIKESIYQKTSILPNGLDEFWFENIKVGSKITNIKDVTLLYVGDINKNKNLLTTAKAVKKLNQEGLNVKFKIVGKIKNKKVFKKINKIVDPEYSSPMPKEKLIEVYKNSDIFVMPSFKETFGLVYGEAMSQGIPVIYSQGQGFDEQFAEGQVGYHVKSLDYCEIATKVIKILDNYEKMSNNCINGAYKFRWNKITKEYTEIYKSLKMI